MDIAKYEAAKNAYDDTLGKYHVRGVTTDGLTQEESSARYNGTFNSLKDAKAEAKRMTKEKANAGHHSERR